jgi:hypothetical protein
MSVNECYQQLKDTIKSIVINAESIGANTVMIPTISSNIFSVAWSICVRAYIDGAFEHNPTTPMTLIFCDKDGFKTKSLITALQTGKIPDLPTCANYRSGGKVNSPSPPKPPVQVVVSEKPPVSSARPTSPGVEVKPDDDSDTDSSSTVTPRYLTFDNSNTEYQDEYEIDSAIPYVKIVRKTIPTAGTIAKPTLVAPATIPVNVASVVSPTPVKPAIMVSLPEFKLRPNKESVVYDKVNPVQVKKTVVTKLRDLVAPPKTDLDLRSDVSDTKCTLDPRKYQGVKIIPISKHIHKVTSTTLVICYHKGVLLEKSSWPGIESHKHLVLDVDSLSNIEATEIALESIIPPRTNKIAFSAFALTKLQFTGPKLVRVLREFLKNLTTLIIADPIPDKLENYMSSFNVDYVSERKLTTEPVVPILSKQAEDYITKWQQGCVEDQSEKFSVCSDRSDITQVLFDISPDVVDDPGCDCDKVSQLVSVSSGTKMLKTHSLDTVGCTSTSYYVPQHITTELILTVVHHNADQYPVELNE